ncbi:glycerol-3-phosphate responsive antiterminator [Oscillospiraceae bacterium MB08-C2-2]|nr:glycerol-3-phosphate responsive antiterminator [Oscillospiraceae bacterium MB08-C2-2]
MHSNFEPIKKIYQDEHILMSIDSMRYFNEAIEAAGSTALVFGDVLNIMNIKRIVQATHEAGKKAFIDMDLVRGIDNDISAVRFLVNEVKADCLITRHRNIIIDAQSHIWCVWKTFLYDILSLNTAISNIEKCRPYAIDIIPGISFPFVYQRLRSITDAYIGIAGFYNETEESLHSLIQNGVDVIYTRNRSLWKGLPAESAQLPLNE